MVTQQMMRQNEEILMIIDKSELEMIEDKVDKYPCLSLRKFLLKTRLGKIITHPFFEYFYLTVIIANSIFLAIDDPTLSDSQVPYRAKLDDFFSSLYFIEFFLKIFGMGFVLNKGAYLRDYWNIPDFLVVIQMIITLLIETDNLKLSVLRAFRILRPLRTISSIEGLKVLVSALISALPLLRDTIIILIFFFFVFAILALQIISGDMRNRCFNIETGVIHSEDLLCGPNTQCPAGYECGKRIQNPNLGITNFDNIFFSLLTVFQCVTLEGWSLVMIMVMKSTHQVSFLIFIPLVFIGAYFLLNLTLAVINYKFNEAHQFYSQNKNKNLDKKQKNQNNSKDKKDNQEDQNPSQEPNSQSQKANIDFGYTIRRYMYAKKAAKQMVAFLRMRQALKYGHSKQRQNRFLRKLCCCFRKRKATYNSVLNSSEYRSTMNLGSTLKNVQTFDTLLKDEQQKQAKEDFTSAFQSIPTVKNKQQSEHSFYSENSFNSLKESKKNKRSQSSNQSFQSSIASSGKSSLEKISVISSKYSQQKELQSITYQRPLTQNIAKTQKKSNMNLKRLIQPFQVQIKSNLEINDIPKSYRNRQNYNPYDNSAFNDNSLKDSLSTRRERINEIINDELQRQLQFSDENQDKEIDHQIKEIINRRYQEECRDSLSRRIDEFEFESLIKDRAIHVRNLENSHSSQDDIKFISNMSLNTSEKRPIQNKKIATQNSSIFDSDESQMQENNSYISPRYQNSQNMSLSKRYNKSYHNNFQKFKLVKEYSNMSNLMIPQKNIDHSYTLFNANCTTFISGAVDNTNSYNINDPLKQKPTFMSNITDQVQLISPVQIPNNENQSNNSLIQDATQLPKLDAQTPQITYLLEPQNQPIMSISPKMPTKFPFASPNNLTSQSGTDHSPKKSFNDDDRRKIGVRISLPGIKKSGTKNGYSTRNSIKKRRSTVIFRKIKPFPDEKDDDEEEDNHNKQHEYSGHLIKLAFEKKKPSPLKRQTTRRFNILETFPQGKQDSPEQLSRKKTQIRGLVDRQLQKITINTTKGNNEYYSSSQADVLEPRLKEQARNPTDINITKDQKAEEDEYIDYLLYESGNTQKPYNGKYRPGLIKHTWKPYDLRVLFQIKEDGISQIINMLLENEEFQMLQEEPFETYTQIAHKNNYNNDYIRSITKRSDLYVTSTLSFTLIPKESKAQAEDQEKKIKSYNQFPQEFMEQFNSLKQKDVREEILEAQIKKSVKEFESEDGSSIKQSSGLSQIDSMDSNENPSDSRSENNNRNNQVITVKRLTDDLKLNLDAAINQRKQSNDSVYFQTVPVSIRGQEQVKNHVMSPVIQNTGQSKFNFKTIQVSPEESVRQQSSKYNSIYNHSLKHQSTTIRKDISLAAQFRKSISRNFEIKRFGLLDIPKIDTQSMNSSTYYKRNSDPQNANDGKQPNEETKDHDKQRTRLRPQQSLQLKDLMTVANLISQAQNTNSSFAANKNSQINTVKNPFLSKLEQVSKAMPEKKQRRKKYKQSEIQKKKEQLEKLSITGAKNFFEGKFYSSDEDEDAVSQQNLQKNSKKAPSHKSSKMESALSEKEKIKSFREDNRGYVQQEIISQEENLSERDMAMVMKNQDQDYDTIDRVIQRIIQQKEDEKDDTNQTGTTANQNKEEEDLSDVPTSLCSDYDYIKLEQRSELFQSAYSKTFAQMQSEIQSQSNKNYINFFRLRKRDFAKRKQYARWSGQDVLGHLLNDDKAKEIVDMINAVQVWPQGPYGFYKKIRTILKRLVTSAIFENFMTICVLINTIILALDKHDADEKFEFISSQFNMAFTYIFCIELGLKLAGLGIKNYFKDTINYLDSAIVVLSIFEIVLNNESDSKLSMAGGSQLSNSNKSSLSAFRVVRIFRTFRVLRVTRLLRQLHSMQIIIGVIQRSIKSFIYIALLLFLFIYIYALLGMTIFGDLNKHEVGLNLSNGNNGPVSRGNFDNFHNAFITVFQCLTMENWQYLLYDTMYFSDVHESISAIYYISWIFIGNFILLNLFLAILLDSFLEEDHEEGETIKKEEEKIKQFEEEQGLGQKQKKPSKLQKRTSMREKPTSMASLRKKNKKPVNEILTLLKRRRSQTFISEPQKTSEMHTEPDKLLDQSVEYQNLDDMDLDEKMKLIQSTDIFVQQTQQKEEDLFKDVECESSLYVFSKQNKMRQWFMRFVKHRYFERIILTIIILSSIKLAVDTYFLNYSSDSIQVEILDKLDLFFTSVFFLETLIKSIAYGLVSDRNSYLRESWNILDFFIVVSSLLDAFISGIDVPVIKILRLLRTLRPLRFISHNNAMKTLVVALLESVGSILNVMIVIMVSWLMFAILGVSFFGGKFKYCSVGMYEHSTEIDCIKHRGEWMTYKSNFDDVINAMITLFTVSSLENWPSIMYQAVDSTEIDKGPELQASPEYAYYFVGFILVGSFFFLNFFIGVLFLNFKLAQKKDQELLFGVNGGKQDERQAQWKDIQKMIINTKPDFETTNVPRQPWRKKFHALVSSNQFDVFIMICIGLNMMLMACTYEDANQEYLEVLDDINIVFTFIFVLEAILKFIGYGVTYFKNNWNIFDFIIILLSLAEIVVEQLEFPSFQILRTAPQVVRVLRVLRISRIMRLIGKYEGLQALISTIMFSLPPLINVMSLLMLIFFIFAILGVFMFKDVEHGQIISQQDYMNFSNFSLAMLMLFRISTGEDWNMVMYDTMDSGNCKFGTQCVSAFAPLYFISFVLICTFVMLNLFVLIILQEFDKYYLPKDNVIAKFRKDLQHFKDQWKEFTMDRYNCEKIKVTEIVPFLLQLKYPLGFSQQGFNQIGKRDNAFSENEMYKEIIKMSICIEAGQYVYFNEMLYRCMKRAYGKMESNREMLIFEINTQLKIRQQTRSKNSKFKSLIFKKLQSIAMVQQILNHTNCFNPFLSRFYNNLIFRSWFRIAKTNKTQFMKRNQTPKHSTPKHSTPRHNSSKQILFEPNSAPQDEDIYEIEYESQEEILLSEPEPEEEVESLDISQIQDEIERSQSRLKQSSFIQKKKVKEDLEEESLPMKSKSVREQQNNIYPGEFLSPTAFNKKKVLPNLKIKITQMDEEQQELKAWPPMSTQQTPNEMIRTSPMQTDQIISSGVRNYSPHKRKNSVQEVIHEEMEEEPFSGSLSGSKHKLF